MQEHISAPDGRHRKALRAASLEMHRIATAMKQRSGHIPPDEPKGYVDAYSKALRGMARLLEQKAKSTTCAQMKRLVIDQICSHGGKTAEGRAHANAVTALLVMVNQHATRAGIDPFAGLRPENDA